MSPRALGHAAGLFTATLWGLTFISTRTLLDSLSPLEILALRFALGYCALWLLHPRWLPWQGAKTEAVFAAAGLTGVTLYFMFENVALTYTGAANVGVIVTTAPLFTALLAWALKIGARPEANFYAGFILAMSGIVLIAFNGASFSFNPLGDFLALLAGLTWAFYTLLTRKLALLNLGALPATRRIFFYGLLFMTPLAAIWPFGFAWTSLFEPRVLFNLLFLGLGASAVCFATWAFTVGRLGAAAASVYIYLVPAITVISAAVALGEPLTLLSGSGAGLAMCGLAVAEAPWRHSRPH